MATLVLSTVGNALGGPVGGAIGALIGQSFDQQLLAPASRGPRVGDLSVQTSSYGTQIPRIYGAMRVAGSVIWATDLIESEQTAGAKGQPDVVYSYSVSLAVALSSRRAGAIGRIWADGKLLRGAEGDFKVPTTFRFHDGDESQAIDPLIGSVEGLASTPAYRGLAVAVFENLELAEFGNRIPFMTFEVFADPDAPAIAAIMADASDGAIASVSAETVVGLAAYGRSVADAIQPLVDAFDVMLFDDGSALRQPADSAPVAVAASELGSSADGRKVALIEREQLPVGAVPSTLRLGYYDPARDYQAGEARASAGEQGGNDAQRDLPAALSADGAKSLVQQMLARQWAERERLTLRLPPARMGLEPGTIVQPAAVPGSWVIDKCTIDGFVAVVELRPLRRSTASLLADAGRIVANKDMVQGPVSLLLIDVLNPTDIEASAPAVLIAASSVTPGWSVQALNVSCAGQTFATQTAVRKSVLGQAMSVLADGSRYLIDDSNSVDIELIDPQQWIMSCTDDALAAGANLALLGSELVQFGAVLPIGAGRFRLMRLLRGRGGTEWAMASHSSGEPFCLLDRGSMRALPLPISMRGTEVTAADRNGSGTTVVFNAESVAPLSPVNVTATVTAEGGVMIEWTRRSRSGFVWVDEIDAPLGESSERYRVTIITGMGSLELTTDRPTLVATASDLASIGGGAARIEVRQLGDWAASRAAQILIALPQE